MAVKLKEMKKSCHDSQSKRKLVLGDEALRLQVHQKNAKKGMTATDEIARAVRKPSAKEEEKKPKHEHNQIWTGLSESQNEVGRQVNSKICIRRLLQILIPPDRN